MAEIVNQDSSRRFHFSARVQLTTFGAAINICENVITGSRLFPERCAIVFDDHRFTYADVERLSAHAAGLLRDLGIEPQDRIALVLPNVPAFVVWYYACLRLGAIVVSISTRLGSEEVAFMLADSGASVVVGVDSESWRESIDGELPDSVLHVVAVSEDGSEVGGEPLRDCQAIGQGACLEMEPDQPATILYTSGTTGFPKGATLSHRNVRATIHAFNHLCGMQPGDVLLLSVPLFHCYGQNAILNSGLSAGATIVLQRRFDLAQSKRLIADHQVSMLFGVPTTFQLMLESCDPDDLSSIRYCFSAAAKLSEKLSHGWFEKFGKRIFEGYGLTETAPFASYNHRLQFVPGSIGMPVDLVEMKIVDPDTGQDCPAGVPGEIIIRGPNVMLGYWNRPEETASAIRAGWFYSGDIGETDPQGYFYIVDRLKDMIVVSGLKVFPAEVERVLSDHPAVSESAVVGFADEVLGEKVVAFVVPASKSTATEAEIRSHCQAHLGSYKIPRRIVFVDQLPRNPAGKVLKTQLRETDMSELLQRSGPGDASDRSRESSRDVPVSGQLLDPRDSASPSTGSLFELLRKTHPASRQRLLTSLLQTELQTLTGRSEAHDPETPIIGEEVDSLMIVEFRDRLQLRVGTRPQFPATLVFDHPTLSGLAAHLIEAFESFESDEQTVSAASFKVAPASTPPIPTLDAPDDPPRPDEQIESMSEQQAMEALLREVND